MSIFLGDLYQNTKQQYHLTLIAGQNGLNRIVNWIYIAEDIGNARFLKGEELVISTGLSAIHDKDWLKPFILALIEKETCGLILNIGKYVTKEDITPEIISICQKHQFPLLTMPWEIHLSDLTQDYWYRIFSDRQNSYDLASALKAVLRDQTPSPHVMELLTSQSYLRSDTYCLAILEFSADTSSYHQCIQQIRKGASYCSSARKMDFIFFEYHKQLVLVWHNTSKAVIHSHSGELLRICGAISSIYNIWIGISQNCSDLMRLPKLYQQAYAALGMAKGNNIPRYYFDDLGCYQIFFSVSDYDVLRQYYQKYLGQLEDYDKVHDSDYLETLEYYLRYNGHLSAIADAMICHRNTINYRINKIRDFLKADLNDGETKFQLQLALNIRNFLKVFGD